MSDNRRVHIRTALNATVSLTHPALGKHVYKTRDISDGGIFIVTEADEMPAIGDSVEVQVQGLPVPAPILKMKVVRITVDGFGLQFMDE